MRTKFLIAFLFIILSLTFINAEGENFKGKIVPVSNTFTWGTESASVKIKGAISGTTLNFTVMLDLNGKDVKGSMKSQVHADEIKLVLNKETNINGTLDKNKKVLNVKIGDKDLAGPFKTGVFGPGADIDLAVGDVKIAGRIDFGKNKTNFTIGTKKITGSITKGFLGDFTYDLTIDALTEDEILYFFIVNIVWVNEAIYQNKSGAF